MYITTYRGLKHLVPIIDNVWNNDLICCNLTPNLIKPILLLSQRSWSSFLLRTYNGDAWRAAGGVVIWFSSVTSIWAVHWWNLSTLCSPFDISWPFYIGVIPIPQTNSIVNILYQSNGFVLPETSLSTASHQLKASPHLCQGIRVLQAYSPHDYYTRALLLDSLTCSPPPHYKIHLDISNNVLNVFG